MKTQSIVNVAKLITFAAAASFGLLSTSPAFAGSATSSMGVSASVSNNCTISAAALSFGAYDPGVANASTPLDASANLTVQCTLGSSASIELGQGSNADAASSDAAPLRRLADGAGHFLSYALDQDGAHAVSWGNTSGTGHAYSGVGTSEQVSVYGRIAPAQNVPAGSFTDSVVATINF
jgi:spore coat protein U-like protein